jgi:hypothetical protein
MGPNYTENYKRIENGAMKEQHVLLLGIIEPPEYMATVCPERADFESFQGGGSYNSSW